VEDQGLFQRPEFETFLVWKNVEKGGSATRVFPTFPQVFQGQNESWRGNFRPRQLV
jgi:hypothetical protein